MTTFDHDQLLDMVVKSYFSKVDSKLLDEVIGCFLPNSTLTIQTDNLTHYGRDTEIRRMFTDFFKSFDVIWHGDFNPIVDVQRQAVVVQFNALRVRFDGGEERANNINVFRFEDGKFLAVTIYMSDENPLR